MWPKGQQGRPVRALIDKAAFRHNIELAEALASPAQALVVVKADAYGHGMLELASAAGDRDLGVASSDEALRLHEAGVTNRTWVLEGPFSDQCFKLSKVHDIVWVIHSDWQLALLTENSDQAHKVWFKIDSGMHRLGFAPEKVPFLLDWLSKSSEVSLLGWFTHFSSSDEWQTPHTQRQMAVFNDAVSQSSTQNNSVDDNPALCLANSAAVLKHPLSHQDWVRPGIMLYGGISKLDSAEDCKSLEGQSVQRAVMTFRSAVMALRKIKKGEAVGYGRTWTAERDSMIATIAVGYADGYPRHAPNGTPVLVKGQRAALVGRVSMDMITVDVTDLTSVAIGDEVELWGKALPIEEVAECAGTISYELMTRITDRVPKVYSD